ncbi:MAG: uncharacterized protein DUF3300 [Candidatus Accumulibacter regalis]|jgi:uncharacterized membrane protein YgcG|uniref:DUF3300 domain-containing protein n=1 Tax=unclassified Candidatus Accumulibacter TaxID=2619054 RepID=UPI0025C2921F|nr:MULTISPECIES: DUF3300 domain-containing protein [unclassified Candidatus Accumulibacter]
MNEKTSRSCALLTALVFAVSPTLAQQAPAAPAQAASASPAQQTFSQEDLDRLLAPIALYPDALLAQVLMASTYPLEVVEAARWAKANPKVTGKALEDAMVRQQWDPAVKSLTSVPEVLKQMNENLSWTQKLGDAFLAQQPAVMDTVQSLRAKADANGNLKTTEQQVVKTETQGSQTIYVVESPKPDVVYVPTYNPSVVYGSWWYPTPPYTVYPPAYVYPPGLAFATGILVGAAIWGACNWGWGRGSVDINVNRYNSFNRTNISNRNWNHNVQHRRGVAYRDQNVARQYNRGGNASAAQARDNFRGRAESGRSELKGMDRSQLNDRVQNANRGAQAGTRDRPDGFGGGRATASDRMAGGDARASAGNRMDGGGDRASAGNRMDGGSARSNATSSARGSGFSGAGNGHSTREASQRGQSSRSQMSHASSGGGRAGGGGGHRGGGGRGGGGGGRGR